MIEIDKGLRVDVRHIESLQRGYVSGSFDFLYISMSSGIKYVVEKNRHAIETLILDSKRAADRNGK